MTSWHNNSSVADTVVSWSFQPQRDVSTHLKVLISKAVDDGLLTGTKLSLGWSSLKVLEGDPEFEAIQVRMFEHMNAERAELGLEPVTI